MVSAEVPVQSWDSSQYAGVTERQSPKKDQVRLSTSGALLQPAPPFPAMTEQVPEREEPGREQEIPLVILYVVKPG